MDKQAIMLVILMRLTVDKTQVMPLDMDMVMHMVVRDAKMKS